MKTAAAVKKHIRRARWMRSSASRRHPAMERRATRSRPASAAGTR